MCGIVGAVWNRPEDALERETLERMTRAIVHRGPDDSGEFFSAALPMHHGPTRCAFGFRRLSIIDLAGGHQPLCNEAGDVWIVFNGEIFNYRELREGLVARGHQFSTSSDTETIVHLYEELGPRCVDALRGFFAFAIWDQTRQRLLLARDRMGQKPLFYRQQGSRLLFASELKSLLQVPGAPREMDPEAVDLFLTYQYVPHPRSILKGYHKLPPAHTAVFENGTLSVQRYWEAPYEPDDQFREQQAWPVDKWKKELRSTLTEAVRLRMRADVPLGAFLSGGVDSTIIAGLMQSLSDRPIHTFSIGFPVPEFDERSYARAAAAHIGSEHHEYLVEPSALNTLPRLVWQYDEPFGDSSSIPMLYLSEVTRRLVTVALSGDGGDELFAGYTRYQAVELASRTDWLPAPVKQLLAWNLWQKIPTSTKQRSFGRRLKRFVAALGQSPEKRYLRWIGIFDEDSRRELYTEEFKRLLQGFDSSEFLLQQYARCPNRDFVTRTTCVDVHSYLPCDILTKVDIATMGCSLEARSPFMDHPLVELAARMPIELKFEPGRGKKILTETFADLIPESIQKRPKMGFGVPIDHWFRNELTGLLKETLLGERALARGMFRPAAIQRLIDDHVSGRWDHSYRLWNLLCLECWRRIYLDGPPPIAPPETI